MRRIHTRQGLTTARSEVPRDCPVAPTRRDPTALYDAEKYEQNRVGCSSGPCERSYVGLPASRTYRVDLVLIPFLGTVSRCVRKEVMFLRKMESAVQPDQRLAFLKHNSVPMDPTLVAFAMVKMVPVHALLRNALFQAMRCMRTVVKNKPTYSHSL